MMILVSLRPPPLRPPPQMQINHGRNHLFFSSNERNPSQRCTYLVHNFDNQVDVPRL